MNEVLKQRLVGALILLALGVVFWPIIFVEPGTTGGAGETRIPPRPRVDRTPVETPDLAGLRASPEIVKDESDASPKSGFAMPTAGADTRAPAEAKGAERLETTGMPEEKPEQLAGKDDSSTRSTRSKPPVKPALDADGIPITWILRVASVSSPTRADELRNELLKSGHKAYVKKIRSSGKQLYRVYVGPKAEKAKLEQIRSQIDSQFGVTSMITRYYP